MVFTVYGCGSHHGHVTNPANVLLFPHPTVAQQKKIFENGGRWTDGQTDDDDGLTTDHGYTIRSPMSLKLR